MKKRTSSEYQEQIALVQWIRWQPHLKDYLIKLNNEGKRTARQGRDLKLMGMMPGASDLFLAIPLNKYSGIWIEVKRNKIYTSSEMKTTSWQAQIKFQENMRKNGYYAFFAYGWEHGKKIIEDYLNGKPNNYDSKKIL